ncbi:hypothetical protein SAMN05660420_00027 [Desulfuromusa kysingii]|uniref:Uncharacterized protein n=1 Tax=Desulfuromusa kysingii TaxID=37625 RepID=A0A1H3VG57_9BACT|nr:hypothetical protein [Desulfuromusa kysingii]SDZ73773.1 hypothetical protein SAMN05660420_00027 [Desulfuromusa kysingii]
MSPKIDDSCFSLFLRFAGFTQELSSHDDEFCKKQLEEIRAHIAQYQPEERGKRALQWIEQYARGYRDRWNKKIIAAEASNHRCLDCPLCDDKTQDHCAIHDQWLELLQKYIANEVNTQEYTKKTLELLTAHKEDLKVKVSELSLD